MENNRLVHDLIVGRLRGRLARDYDGVKVNPGGGPDLELSSHGLTLAAVEVETERSITPERAARWKEIAGAGTKLILMVPKNRKAKATELLWEAGIADRVALGSYEIRIEMP